MSTTPLLDWVVANTNAPLTAVHSLTEAELAALVAEQLATLQSQYDTLLKELEAARNDANRYQWVRQADIIDWDSTPAFEHYGLDAKQLLDAIADKAIAAQSGKEK